MTFPFLGTGGLFTRWGTIGKLVNECNVFRGTTLNITDVLAQYLDNPEIIPTAETDYLSSQNNYSGYLTNLQQYVQNTAIDMVADYNPQPNLQLITALQEVSNLMFMDSQSISENTISSTISADVAYNNGDGSPVTSLVYPNGYPLNWIFNENVVVTCVADSLTGGTTEGNETFTFRGEYAISNPLQFNWPVGSGSSLTLNAVSATTDNSSGNILTDGTFSTWLSTTPLNWTLDAGSIGTDFGQGMSNTFYGPSAEFIAAGHNCILSQKFGNSLGTLGTLQPLTVYAVSFWARATSAITGTFSIGLWDIDTASFMTNGIGQNQTASISTGSFTNSWAQYTVTFETPRIMPGNYSLGLHADFASGGTLNVNFVAMTTARALYTGGPSVAIFSGAYPFVLGDNFTIAMSNDYSSLWNQFLQQTLNLNQLGIIIPTSGSPTVADSLLE